MIQLIWFAMMTGSVLYAAVTDRGGQILPALLKGCENAIALTLQLGAGYLLFCGLMEIAKEAGVPRGMERMLRPVLRRLMPSVREESTRRTIAMNLSMNMLGMGNAATPLGIEAVKKLDAEAAVHPPVRHDLWMLLVLNATSIQLLPTTVLTLRTLAGSADVNAIVVPSLLCTAVSTFVGAGLASLWRRYGGRRG